LPRLLSISTVIDRAASVGLQTIDSAVKLVNDDPLVHRIALHAFGNKRS
jgi:hypothetical protein